MENDLNCFRACREYCNLPTEFPPETAEWNRLLWDGKSPFDLGMAETHRIGMARSKDEMEINYAVVAHNLGESEPYIKKSFGGGMLAIHTEGDKKGKKMFGRIWIVPNRTLPNTFTPKITANDVPKSNETKITDRELDVKMNGFIPDPEVPIEINIPIVDKEPKQPILAPQKVETTKPTEWLIDGVNSEDEAREWLKSNGAGQGLHFIKGKESLIEKIQKVLDEKQITNK